MGEHVVGERVVGGWGRKQERGRKAPATMSGCVRDYSIQWEAAWRTCVEANRQPDFDQGRRLHPLLASACTCPHPPRRTLWKDESSMSRKYIVPPALPGPGPRALSGQFGIGGRPRKI
jgi:hypothetical protein